METDTTQNFPFGFKVRAFDPILGFGEFVYLQGVASTVAGSAVTFNPFTGVTTLDAATANDGSPIAFAVAPCVAGLFGWYQVSGTAVAANNGTAAAGNAFRKATGQIGSAAVAGTQILGGAKILVANGSTFTKVGTTRNGSTGPNSRNSSAGSAAGLIMSAAATADGTVTVTFTRTNFSLLGGQNWFTQGAIT
jgi:hypothetical protein